MSGSRATWNYAFQWATLEVFADVDAIPDVLRPTADILLRLDVRFRPALLNLPTRPDIPYVAVWPEGRSLPEPTHGVEPGEERLHGVVLGQVGTLTCFRCGERFHGVRPEGGLPFLSRQLSAHELVNGCPSCGSDFSSSRVQGLAILPLPSLQIISDETAEDVV